MNYLYKPFRFATVLSCTWSSLLLGTGPCCSEGKEAKSAKDARMSKLIGFHHLYTCIEICIYDICYAHVNTYVSMCITVFLTIMITAIAMIVVIVIIVLDLTVIMAMQNCICILCVYTYINEPYA